MPFDMDSAREAALDDVKRRNASARTAAVIRALPVSALQAFVEMVERRGAELAEVHGGSQLAGTSRERREAERQWETEQLHGDDIAMRRRESEPA